MPKESKAKQNLEKTLSVDNLRWAEYYDMQSTFDELYAKEPLNKSPSVSAERENRRLPLGSSDSVGK